MKLITKEIEKSLQAAPLYSTEGNEKADVIVKYFNPGGVGTWYITEGEKQTDGDWLLYGLCCIHEAELGYVLLSDLQNFKLPFGLTIERDLHYRGNLIDAHKEIDKIYR